MSPADCDRKAIIEAARMRAAVMCNHSDRRLLDTVRGGQIDGLAELFDRHGNHCLRIALQRTGDKALAEEVVFTTFMTFWRDPPADCPQPLRRHLSGLAALLAADCVTVEGPVTAPNRLPQPTTAVARRPL